eukprot:365023-Chlamydomonas_euryale.AAC.7
MSVAIYMCVTLEQPGSGRPGQPVEGPLIPLLVSLLHWRDNCYWFECDSDSHSASTLHRSRFEAPSGEDAASERLCCNFDQSQDSDGT